MTLEVPKPPWQQIPQDCTSLPFNLFLEHSKPQNQPPFDCAKPHLCELCKDFFQHRKGTGENRGGCRVGFKDQGLRLLCVFLRHKPTAGHVWLRHVAAAAGKDADAR